MTVHPIPPLYDGNSRILILGSFPSVKSREEGFFYGHPQNRFWRVMAELLGYTLPKSVAEKKEMLLSEGIAVWDVIGSCEIRGSADSSIREVKPNDLTTIVSTAPINKVFLNGKSAARYYEKYQAKRLALPYEALPSTSPANAACSYQSLLKSWQAVVTSLKVQ